MGLSHTSSGDTSRFPVIPQVQWAVSSKYHAFLVSSTPTEGSSESVLWLVLQFPVHGPASMAQPAVFMPFVHGPGSRPRFCRSFRRLSLVPLFPGAMLLQGSCRRGLWPRKRSSFNCSTAVPQFCAGGGRNERFYVWEGIMVNGPTV